MLFALAQAMCLNVRRPTLLILKDGQATPRN